MGSPKLPGLAYTVVNFIKGNRLKTILVTGGAGFIGANLTRHLLRVRVGSRVVVLDKLTYAGNLLNLREVKTNSRFQFVRGDIADPVKVRAVFQRFKPDEVYHLAAESHVDRSIDGARAFVETNVMGTFELLEAARIMLVSNPKRRTSFRFILVSTDEVYGSLGPKGYFREETPYSPNSPYSATKAGADHLGRAYFQTHGLPVLLTHCSNNYGPFQFPEKLIPLTILNALEGKPLPIYGDGSNVRDWIHVEDHCSALEQVGRQGRAGETYNVGGGNEITNLSLVKALCECLDSLKPSRTNPWLQKRGVRRYKDLMTFVTDRPGHDHRYAIDDRKIRRDLGWKPRWDIQRGLRATVEWYLKNLKWCQAVQKDSYGRERLGLARKDKKS